MASHCITEKALPFLRAWQVPTRTGSSCFLKLLSTLCLLSRSQDLKLILSSKGNMRFPRNRVLFYFSSLIHILIKKAPFSKEKVIPLKITPRDGEIAQELRVLLLLQRISVQLLVHIWWLKTTCSSSFRGSSVLFWPPWVCAHM